MLLNINREIAAILGSYTVHADAVHAIREYADYQIKQINEQIHQLDLLTPYALVQVAELKGQRQVYKQLLTLKEDVRKATSMEGK